MVFTSKKILKGNIKMRILSLLKTLIPVTLYSQYSTNGHREVAVWRMWFGKSYDVKRWEVV
jgi:hypothetical protein